MPGWRSVALLGFAVLGPLGVASAQSPVFRSLEEPFPPGVSGSLAWADFDQDGDQDALAFGSNVFLNDGSAKFSPHPVPSVVGTIGTGLEPHGRMIFAVADLNGDGFPDVVTTTGTLGAWINQGNGVLVPGAAGLFPALPWPQGSSGATPSLILAGDVDADGDADLVVALGAFGPTQGWLWVPVQPQLLLNTPAGFVLATAQLPTIPVTATQGFLRDLDQDADLDLFFADNDSWTASCLGPNGVLPQCLTWLNDGSGTFVQSQALVGPSPRGFVALADVNGDGLPDLASSPFASTITCGAICQLALNLGAGAFGPWAVAPCSEPGVILGGSLYGNGTDQIIRLTASGTSVHQGLPGGISGPPQILPFAAADGDVVDVDGDTDLDVVIRLGSRTAVLLTDAQGSLIPYAGALWGAQAAQWIVNALDVEDVAAVGDVDGNGSPDLVWSPGLTTGQSMRVALNDGNGAFTAVPGFCNAGSCPGGSGNPSYCATRQMFGLDVDGNGLLDLFTIQDSFSSNCLAGPSELHLNTGSSWALALTLPASSFSTTQVKQGDLNGDGLPDLLVARESGIVPSLVLFNQGAQGWSAPVLLPNHATRDVALVDLDGDGDLDVVEANWLPTYDGCAVLLNDGVGNFTPTTVPGVSGSSARTVTAGDLDGDGDRDLVLDQQIWLNGPGLGFVAGSLLPVAQSIVQLRLFDADADGDSDLVAGTKTLGANATAVLLLNDGAANFTLGETIVNGFTSWVQAADFDRDSDVDLFVPGPRVLTNITRQIAKGSMIRAGRTCSLDLFGPSNGAWHLFASTATAVLPVPPIGTVLLDVPGLQPFGSGSLSPSGTATLSMLLPPPPALVGFTTYLQALVGPPAHVTNLEVITVLDL